MTVVSIEERDPNLYILEANINSKRGFIVLPTMVVLVVRVAADGKIWWYEPMMNDVDTKATARTKTTKTITRTQQQRDPLLIWNNGFTYFYFNSTRWINTK